MTAPGLGALPPRFTKMSGAGNDFLVFSEAVGVGAAEAAAIRRLCRRGTGVGADGVLFVTAEGPRRVAADYYNADGSLARFCGNGTRCAARFAALKGLAPETLIVRTGWGDVGARVEAGRVTLELPEPVAVGRAVSSLDPGATLRREAYALAVGVPHVVAFVADGVDLATLDLARLGPALRHHPEMRDGANASFAEVLGPCRLRVRTWERGVEAETLACGAGSVATAVTAAALGRVAAPVSLETRSGQVLEVGFRFAGEVARDVTLAGDARVVFEGTLDPKEWEE
ncbi:MAG TPA: diaminopimelate epimerase [Thermoanaerobaculia bacterium]|nr:diaminopimelate epimerase [Thermoanaerobaculia bacterium]